MDVIPPFRCSVLGKGVEEEGSSPVSWGRGRYHFYSCVLTSQAGGRLPQAPEKQHGELGLAFNSLGAAQSHYALGKEHSFCSHAWDLAPCEIKTLAFLG